MGKPNQQSALSLADCREHLDQRVFKLQPANYGRDYPKWPGLIGIEVEMLPGLWEAPMSRPRQIPLFEGAHSIAELLLEKTLQEPRWTAEVQSLNGDSPAQLMRVALDHDDQITFEPGGQIEFSSSPYPCLSDAAKRVKEVQKNLDQLFATQDIRLFQLGINPWFSVDEIGLQMNKSRYRAMNQHFLRISEYGKRMMRQTCTVQVNLDFGVDDGVLVRRFLASQLIAPFATAIFAYSPYVDRRQTPYRTMRAKCWQELDPSRTGFPDLETVFQRRTRASVVQSYLDHLLSAQVVFIEALDYKVPPMGFSFGRWLEEGFEGVFPNLGDWQTHMSLHFPEVRARGFMELRSVDCQSRVWQFVPSAFYTGLLYDDCALDAVLELLEPYKSQIIDFWQQSVYGLQNEGLADLAQKICRISIEGFSRLPPCFRDVSGGVQFANFLSRFTERRRCPADDLIDQIGVDGSLTVETIDRVEELWRSLK